MIRNILKCGQSLIRSQRRSGSIDVIGGTYNDIEDEREEKGQLNNCNKE